MPGSGRYHHGDLPNVLKRVAAEVIVEKGAAGFSLREVSRRAGVSHAAPAHHFGDTAGLLTAIAIDGFRAQADAFKDAAASAAGPSDRLIRMGVAYVEVGVELPGHFAVAYRSDLVDTTDPEYSEWSNLVFSYLESALIALRDEVNPDLDVGVASGIYWSMMYGLLQVYPLMKGKADQHGDDLHPIERLADEFGHLVLAGFVGRR